MVMVNFFTFDDLISVLFVVLTGMGAGMAFTSAMVVISVYFMRLRPLALGLSTAGAGFGNIFFPWITSLLIEEYGWRGKQSKPNFNKPQWKNYLKLLYGQYYH